MSKGSSAEIKKQRKLARKRFEKHKRLNAQAEPGCHNCIVVLDNLKPDFNIGKVFRSADAFGVREVFLIGVDYFDPGPAKGSFKWVPARFFKNMEECYQELRVLEYAVYALDPDAQESVDAHQFAEKSAFIFGHEEFGLSFAPQDYPDIKTLSIKQYGRVQSLNVSVAASLMMYEYVSQQERL